MEKQYLLIYTCLIDHKFKLSTNHRSSTYLTFHTHTVSCQTMFNHACFAVIPLQLSWFDAKNHCVLLGGRLAEVTNSDINDALKKFADSKYFFQIVL